MMPEQERVPTAEEARRALRELRLHAMKDWMNPDFAEKHCDRILAFIDAHDAPVPKLETVCEHLNTLLYAKGATQEAVDAYRAILTFLKERTDGPVPEDVERAMSTLESDLTGEAAVIREDAKATIRNALRAALQRAETAEAELDRLFTAAVRLVGFTRNNEYPERMSPEADELTRLIDNLDTVARRLAARRGAASKEGGSDVDHNR